MIRVRITEGISNEFMTRDVFHDLWDTGQHEVNNETFLELLDDAKFNADPQATDMDGRTRAIYKTFLKQLNARLL